MPKQFVTINDREYWVKLVEMLQQNWALVEDNPSSGVTIYFLLDNDGLYASDDGSQIFDEISYSSREEAFDQLARNGFQVFDKFPNSNLRLRPPPPPFFLGEHPNGKIYSSGRFWTTW